MAVIDQLLGLLTITVELEPWTGQDQYGRGTYGAKRTVKGQLSRGTFAASGPNGQSLVAQYKLILGEPLPVDVRDRLTLPAAFGTRDAGGKFTAPQPAIQEVRPIFYEGRHDYTVVLCG